MDGIIVINKEKGYTSNDIVQIVKKTFKQKVGHTGTLDPMATGVLPVLIGKGTRLSKYLINHDKIYMATLKLGIKTDTGDITGNIIERKKINKQNLNKQKILDVLENIKGEQHQTPPMYSAIKINGKKLYEYARKGQTVEIPSRKIKIYNIELIKFTEEEITYRVNCSKGTYIRTLCEKIAEELGEIGTMSELKREKVGEFDLKQAIKIDELENNELKNFISIEKYFENAKKITLSARSYIAFINGVKLFTDEKDGKYRIYDINNKFVGIGVVKTGILKRDIVI